jgi:hypothetical protein
MPAPERLTKTKFVLSSGIDLINFAVQNSISSNKEPSNPFTYNGYTYKVYLFTSTANITFTSTMDINTFQVNYLIIGGGGGGGGGSCFISNALTRGGGGGGGGILEGTITISSGTQYSVTVGTGGSAGSKISAGVNTATPGGIGYNSSFNSLIAYGGGGGGGGGINDIGGNSTAGSAGSGGGGGAGGGRNKAGGNVDTAGSGGGGGGSSGSIGYDAGAGGISNIKSSNIICLDKYLNVAPIQSIGGNETSENVVSTNYGQGGNGGSTIMYGNSLFNGRQGFQGVVILYF